MEMSVEVKELVSQTKSNGWGERGLTKPAINLQDGFLNQVRKENIPVTVYLVNGFQLKGMVRGFDNFTVVLEQDGKQMLVYKHALSTISPMRPINYNFSQPAARAEGEA